jgi:hypothetical protein
MRKCGNMGLRKAEVCMKNKIHSPEIWIKGNTKEHDGNRPKGFCIME